jgi:beta-lactamase superfamily II metal-dependent hydrolase
VTPRFASRFALLGACLALFAPAAALGVTPNGRLQVIHLNVGQGDGTVLITPMGQVVLIDDGLYNNTAAPVAQLAALGVTHVDLHFASHYHADHIGAIAQIQSSGVTIDAGWDRGQSYTSATYTNYVNALGVKRHTIAKNQVFTLDVPSAHPVVIKCVEIGPAGLATSDENSKSIVLRVTYGEFDAVFAGDLTGTATGGSADVETVAGPQVGPVELYKVNHHGSRYSSNDNWLNAITPKIGVIQCGNGNSYGHPTADALGRLHAHGVRTYWTQTGAGVAPNPAWDTVANGQVIVQATWEPAGVDTVRGPGFAHTFTNSGSAVDVTAPSVNVISPNGGELWDAGSAHVIRWAAADNVALDSVNVDYSTSGIAGPWNAIQHGIAGRDTLAWSLPWEVTDSALVRVTAFDHALNQRTDGSNATFEIQAAGPVGVDPTPLVALSFAPPRPNPSGRAVTLEFTLPAAGNARLDVMDIAGRRVWSWQEPALAAGPHVVSWEGRTLAGTRVAEGLYWARLTAASGTRTVKLVRLR